MKKTTNEELHRPSAEEYARMRKMPVTVVLDNIRSLNNVGSFFRTCDAFAVERLLLCGITGTPPSREIHKTALGAENTVAWQYFESTAEAVESLRREGYVALAVEQAEGAVMLEDFRPEPANAMPSSSAMRWRGWHRRWPTCATVPSRYPRRERNTP